MSDLEIEILIITFQSVRRIRKCMYMSSLFGKGKVGGGGGRGLLAILVGVCFLILTTLNPFTAKFQYTI